MLNRESLPGVILVIWILALGAGCRASAPPRTGFLQDYSKLKEVDRSTYRDVSHDLAGYDFFLIDPVEFRIEQADAPFDQSQLEEAARYLIDSLSESLKEAGFTAAPGQSDIGYPEGSARVRFAITDLRAPTILLNLHPGSKLTGAGTGGAAMEGEITDATTGQQLAAFVQANRGNQFEFDQFNRLNDVKDAIDVWVDEFTAELVELREASDD